MGSFGTLSKLVLMAVIIRGRHRGLPNAIDRVRHLKFATDDVVSEG